MRTQFSALTVILVSFLAGCGPRNAGPAPTPAVAEAPTPPDTPAGAPQATAEEKPLQWRYEHDDGGRLVKVVDPAGRPTTFAYQEDGQKHLQRLDKKFADGSAVALAFNADGQARSMTDATGETAYDRDGFGRLTRVKRPGLSDVRLEYDGLDRVAALRVGPDFNVEYVYDFLGRLAAMKTPAGEVRYEYRPGYGEVVRTLPNGVETVWRSRPDGRLQSITHAGKDRIILAQFDYAYRPDGLIAEVKEATARGKKTIHYEYDTSKRLTAVNDSEKGKTAYAYDKVGNRTEAVGPDGKTVSAACDWAGRLVEYGGARCEHDASGGMTRYAGPQGEASLSYAADGLLQTAAVAGAKVEYRHDGAGDLVGRTEGAAAVKFVTDPRADAWRPLEAVEGDKKTFYIWEGDAPLAVVSGGQTRFFLHDHLGSVRGAAGADGKVADGDWFDYDAFGVPASPPAAGLRPGFAGLFYDAGPGLYLARARAYDPALGRFLGRDPQFPMPVSSASDLSDYAYCANDPVNYTDLTGRQFMPPPPPLPPQVFNQNFLPPPVLVNIPQPKPPAEPWHPTWGTQAGEEAAQFYADRYVQTGNPLYAIPGVAASLWTPSTYKATIATLTLPATGGETAILKAVTWAPKVMTLVNSYADVRAGEGWHAAGELAHEFGPDLIHAGTLAAGKKMILGDLDKAISNGDTQFFQKGMQWINRIKEGGDAYDKVHDITEATHGPGGEPAGPTNVGGIYLRGAGDALKGLGALRGVALDKNGRLVLIAEDQGEIGLPPLRLDDVVLIFRRVYETGDNLYVSIDPDPKAPEGDHMNVRLDDKVRDTYVGWVMFQGDRVMKLYSLGGDNETGKDIHSAIKDYKSIFDLDAAVKKDDPTWERFWIVPREVARRQSAKKELTLLDVPLALKTQAMILKDGKLEPKPDGKPSAAADAFCRWFTDHYDDLAREAKLTPPPESGVAQSVAVFEELRRVTLIAGIAETLRDQGRPLPAWMREYVVKPCPTPRTTPGRTFKHGNVSIYGGARLYPESVRTVADDPAANALAPAVLQAVSAAPLLTQVRFEQGGKHYQAVALPGDDSRALGANRLDATDLSVPVEGDNRVALTRHFHSYFSPTEVCGQAWTLDMPRLEEAQRPVEHHGDAIVLKPVYQLYTPLGSATATFADVGKVEGLGKLLVPETAGGPFLGLIDEEDARSGATETVYLRDGGQWRFNKDGDLVAVERPPFTAVYRHDKGRLVGIEGWYADEKRASIALSYDATGRLTRARGGDGSQVEYEYGPDGVLSRVTTPDGKTAYDYKSGLVTGYTFTAAKGDPAAHVERRFEYDAAGRLLSERDGDGAAFTYETKPAADGGVTIVRRAEKRAGAPEQPVQSAEFDASLRPVRRALADGTRLTWTYGKDGTEIAADLPDGGRCVVRRTADGKGEEWTLPGGAQLGAGYDDGGHLTSLTRGGKPAVSRQWQPDGTLEATQMGDSTQASFHHDPKTGAVTGVFMSRPVAHGEKTTDWLQVKVDAHGRIVQTDDAFGATTTVAYDDAGRLVESTSKQGKVTLKRDGAGRVESVETDWGYRQKVTYGPDGPSRQEIGQGDQTVVVEFDAGRPRTIHDFDGGETRITYAGKDASPQTIDTPNGLTLTYEYDGDKRVRSVTCGDLYRIVYEWDAKGRLVGWSQGPLQPVSGR